MFVCCWVVAVVSADRALFVGYLNPCVPYLRSSTTEGQTVQSVPMAGPAEKEEVFDG